MVRAMREPTSARGAAGLVLLAATAVAVVATGEVSGSRAVETPGLALQARPTHSLRGGPRPPVSAEARTRRCRRALPLPPPTTAQGMAPGAIREALRPRKEVPALGSASIGAPNRGALFNGVQLRDGDGIHLRSPHLSWGTEGAVRSIERAVAEVRCRFPDTPDLAVGNLSRREGGGLRSHRSHQSGLDADLGFYYRHGYDWYLEATEDNLDRERTWALVDALVAMGNVQYLFVDRQVEAWLRATAEGAGVAEERLAALFDGTPEEPAIVLHARGHDDHMHVRFVDDAATENTARLRPYLWGRYRHLAGR